MSGREDVVGFRDGSPIRRHPDSTSDPVLPYAGTSGWSGSTTSHDRAVTADDNGTTSHRQQITLGALSARDSILGSWTGAADGLTWRELAHVTGWHHGQASGVLSVLHKAGRIARLTATRNKCAVYVLPEYVNGRETAPHGGRRSYRADADALAAALQAVINAPSHRWPSAAGQPCPACAAENEGARVLTAYRRRTGA